MHVVESTFSLLRIQARGAGTPEYNVGREAYGNLNVQRPGSPTLLERRETLSVESSFDAVKVSFACRSEVHLARVSYLGQT